MDMDQAPEWFEKSDQLIAEVHQKVARAVELNGMPTALKFYPRQAHWFILDSLAIANKANRDGMHANALLTTRQCIEAMSIIELGLCSNAGAEAELRAWHENKRTPGQLRKWLSVNVWPTYGVGLWSEPWVDFMAQLSGAVQSYAHYTAQLAQWQVHLVGPAPSEGDAYNFFARMAPRAYDPQKATRITLFHAILQFAMARILLGAGAGSDDGFKERVSSWGEAIGASSYLDGHRTDWEKQFWSVVWSPSRRTTILE